METIRRIGRLMGWLSDKRLDDHIQTVRDRWRTSEQQHEEMKAQIKDLSDQTRGEFARIRKETEDRHKENRNRIWAVLIAIIGAIALQYLAQHGFTAPGLAHP